MHMLRGSRPRTEPGHACALLALCSAVSSWGSLRDSGASDLTCSGAVLTDLAAAPLFLHQTESPTVRKGRVGAPRRDLTKSDVSVERRLRFQELAISRLMSETRLLRDENAWLLARLEAAREPIPAVGRGDCLETTLPAGRARRLWPAPL
jgi:hypothetical protein